MSSRCRAAALRFLKIRPRSVKELEGKLEAKDFTAGEIAQVVEDLQKTRDLDDRAFAVAWMRYRLARPFGFSRIIGELKDKGVAPEIIAQTTAGLKEEFPEDQTAIALARRRAERLTELDPVKRKKRVLDLLVRRGFLMDVAYKAIKNI